MQFLKTQFLIDFNECGKIISLSDVQPLKANGFILWTESGITILDNDEHPAKVPLSITVIEEGTIISFNEVHLLNEYEPIEFKEELLSNVIFSNE